MKKVILICSLLLIIVSISCRAPGPDGILKGTVTIGPITPVEQPGVNPPVSPAVFAARKILVYDASGKVIKKTLDITQIGQTATGHYQVSLPPGSYLIDLKPNGIDRSAELPKSVVINAGETLTLDISIDTGIR